jgi:hypothetical protein
MHWLASFSTQGLHTSLPSISIEQPGQMALPQLVQVPMASTSG